MPGVGGDPEGSMQPAPHRPRLATAAVALILAALAGTSTEAQIARDVPPALRDVGVDQKLDAQVPLDLTFTDERGNEVRLGDLVRPDRPVVLTLVYYRCPMLCNLVLDGLTDALSQLEWSPGDEFDVISVSIDPLETPQLAQQKKQSYLRALGRPGADVGWRFLTGRREAIHALADSVGFRYEWVEERGEYAHSATLIMLTPEGRVSRYLFGIKHDPRTVRLSLVEAAEGEIGSVVDQFLLYCYKYDAVDGKYTPVAWRLMRLGGGLTAALLGVVLVTFFVRESRQRRIA